MRGKVLPFLAVAAGVLIASLSVSAARPAFGSRVELTFWHSQGYNARKVLERMVDEFNRSHPGIGVKAVYQGSYEEMERKMLEAAGTGGLPTVAQEQFEYMGKYIDDGILEPIDTSVTESDRADILPGFWNLATRNGRTYGVPFLVSTTVFFYNRDAFRRAGLDPEDPPSTWDEMISMGKRISETSEENGKKVKYPLLLWRNGFYGWAPILWAFGGELFTAGGKVDLDSAETVRAVSLLKSLFFTHGIVPGNWSDVRMGLAFMTQNMVMGPFSSAGIRYALEKFPWDLGIAPLPSVNGKRYTVLGGSALLNFARDAETRKSANDFISWLVSRENTIRLHEEVGFIPVRRSAIESDELETFHRRNPAFLVPIREVAHARPLPYHREFFKIDEVLMSMMDRIVRNGADPLAELVNAEKEIRRFL